MEVKRQDIKQRRKRIICLIEIFLKTKSERDEYYLFALEFLNGYFGLKGPSVQAKINLRKP